MKYFIDTEFLEGIQDKTIFGIKCGKTKPTIDLISIGIVAEDGREYYAVSKDFNLKEAWNRWQTRISQGDRNNIEPKEYWVRENVLKSIFNEWNKYGYHDFTYGDMKYCIKCIGKTNKQIIEEIKEFIYSNGDISMHRKFDAVHIQVNKVKPEFYGYYAGYDWVVFCWLFGKMIDLPKGFPMYCRDLKQMLDEKTENKEVINIGNIGVYSYKIKTHPYYPEQKNEHNALEDARWNKKLYEFLNML